MAKKIFPSKIVCEVPEITRIDIVSIPSGVRTVTKIWRSNNYHAVFAVNGDGKTLFSTTAKMNYSDFASPRSKDDVMAMLKLGLIDQKAYDKFHRLYLKKHERVEKNNDLAEARDLAKRHGYKLVKK